MPQLPKILVIGEAMTDRNLVGTVERISPEAPIPVVKITKDTVSPGGAAKVAETLHDLGAEVMVLFQPTPPPTKNRLFVGDTCIARWDEGDSCAPIELENLPLEGFDVVVISDYGKGGFPPAVRAALMERLAAAQLPTFIDTKASPLAWGSNAVFFPNSKEYLAHERGYQQAPKVVRTLGEAGMEYLEHGVRLAFEFPQNLHPRTVIGAGDVVIAAYAFAAAKGRSPREALRFAAEQVGIALTQPYGASL